MTQLYNIVGFDYAQAVRKLNQVYTYVQIAQKIGYVNKCSVHELLAGAIPSHRHGEALWALYVDTFGTKPLFERTKQTFNFLSSA